MLTIFDAGVRKDFSVAAMCRKAKPRGSSPRSAPNVKTQPLIGCGRQKPASVARNRGAFKIRDGLTVLPVQDDKIETPAWGAGVESENQTAVPPAVEGRGKKVIEENG